MRSVISLFVCVAYCAVPLSPFGRTIDICPRANGVPYSVGGFPI